MSLSDRESYRVGTVDFTDASKAYFFPVGVPGLFRQYNAPAETANTIGLPRYAKQAADQQFARWVMLHVQELLEAEMTEGAEAEKRERRPARLRSPQLLLRPHARHPGREAGGGGTWRVRRPR
jgi:Phage major capsid protein E